MKLKFEVQIELERDGGKFSSKDSLAEEIEESLANAEPAFVYGDGEEATYNVIGWEVRRIP